MACWTSRLADVVQGRGPLVEDQDRRVLEEDPGQGDPLPLAAGEVLAPLRDAGLVAAGHHHDLVVDAGHLGGPADLLGRGVRRSRRRCWRRSCRRRRTGSGRRSRSAGRSPRARCDSSGHPADRARSRRSDGPAASWSRSQVVLPHPERPATPIVSPWRIVIETPSSAGLACRRRVAVRRRSRSSATKTGSPTPRLGLAGLGRLERAVDRLAQQLDQVAHPQAALVGLVDEPVDLVQRGTSRSGTAPRT